MLQISEDKIWHASSYFMHSFLSYNYNQWWFIVSSCCQWNAIYNAYEVHFFFYKHSSCYISYISYTLEIVMTWEGGRKNLQSHSLYFYNKSAVKQLFGIHYFAQWHNKCRPLGPRIVLCDLLLEFQTPKLIKYPWWEKMVTTITMEIAANYYTISLNSWW